MDKKLMFEDSIFKIDCYRKHPICEKMKIMVKVLNGN